MVKGYFSQTGMDDHSLYKLCSALEGCKFIKNLELKLSWNKITDTGANKLAHVLKNSKTFKCIKLEIKNFLLTAQNGEYLLKKALFKNPNIHIA